MVALAIPLDVPPSSGSACQWLIRCVAPLPWHPLYQAALMRMRLCSSILTDKQAQRILGGMTCASAAGPPGVAGNALDVIPEAELLLAGIQLLLTSSVTNDYRLLCSSNWPAAAAPAVVWALSHASPAPARFLPDHVPAST